MHPPPHSFTCRCFTARLSHGLIWADGPDCCRRRRRCEDEDDDEDDASLAFGRLDRLSRGAVVGPVGAVAVGPPAAVPVMTYSQGPS